MGDNDVLICDFDGTLIDKNLEASFITYLRKTNSMGFRNYLFSLLSLPVNTLRRHFDVGNLLRAWPIGFSDVEINELLDCYLEQDEAPLLCGKTLSFVKHFEGKKILLTGSDERLVNGFLERKGEGELFDEVIGLTGSSTMIKRHPYGKDKVGFLPMGVRLTGVGNEYVDRYFLEKCDDAYIVNPEHKLREFAKTRSWKVL